MWMWWCTVTLLWWDVVGCGDVRLLSFLLMRKFSPLRLMSSFWLSGHLFLSFLFISEFIWVNVRWNGPTWQAKTTTSYSPPLNSNWKECTLARARDRNKANQSASQDCRLATNQLLKSADLRHRPPPPPTPPKKRIKTRRCVKLFVAPALRVPAIIVFTRPRPKAAWFLFIIITRSSQEEVKCCLS